MPLKLRLCGLINMVYASNWGNDLALRMPSHVLIWPELAAIFPLFCSESDAHESWWFNLPKSTRNIIKVCLLLFFLFFFYFFYFWREKYVFFDSTIATQYCMLQKIRVTNHVGHNVNALRIALRNSPRYHCWSIDRMHQYIIQATIDLERRYRYEIKQITLSSFFPIKA